MSVRRGFASLALLAASACGTLPPEQDVPAVIVQPTVQGRDELRQTIAGALHNAPLTLADDALTRANVLIIERAGARDSKGVPLNGRELGRPEKFQLVKSGSRCVLIQDSSGQRFTLTKIDCAPI
ncbi:MAG TPA: hypothetical protein VEZ88_04375 [Steroidobacteraceae bacterium]|nr:hypothetical protein [Steroidobacteraceae bacterium]